MLNRKIINNINKGNRSRHMLALKIQNQQTKKGKFKMWMNLLGTIWRERGQEQRNTSVQDPIHISYNGKSNSRPGSLHDLAGGGRENY